ncbi:unnamed protein product, partial [Hapterophycus canaliculatus]
MPDHSSIDQRFGVDTEGAKEARSVLSSTLTTILANRDRDGSRNSSTSVAPARALETTSPSPFAPNTSASRTATSSGKRLFSWDRLLLSDDEDEQPDTRCASRSSTRKAPPDDCPRAAAPGPAVGGSASDDNSTDDEEWKEHFAKRGADAAASARLQRAAISEAHIQAKEGGDRTSSSSSSPRGSASKRRREIGDRVDDAGRKPSPPCRANDSGSGSSRGNGGGLALLGERHRCMNPPGCNHSSGVGTQDGRGRSPPTSILLGGGLSIDGGSGGSTFGGGSSGGGCGGAIRLRCGQEMDEEEEGQEEEEEQQHQEAAVEEEVDKEPAEENEDEEGDEEEVDLLGENLKPTLSSPPFEDPLMRPLLLTNDTGGQRAEVPASVNRYLKDYQREGVAFMYKRVRHADGPKGVILADDMGLGKTVQTISLLLALLKKSGTVHCTKQDLTDLIKRKARKQPASAPGKPILIVCPPSVLTSWTKHLADWGHFAMGSITSGGSSTGRTSVQVTSS